jgi:PmbA protein
MSGMKEKKGDNVNGLSVEQLQEKACAWVEEGQRLGAAEVEVYVQDSTGLSVKAYQGEVEELRSSAAQGVGVRVFEDGKLGYAYASGLEEEEIRHTIRDALDNARYSTPDQHNLLPEALEYTTADLRMYDEETASTPVERKVEMALELEEITRTADPRIRAVESAAYADSVYRVALANSRGFCGGYEGCDCHCYVMPIAGEGEDSQSGFSFSVGKKPSELDLAGCSGEATERALAMLGASSLASRRTTIVLDNLIAAEFLGVLASALSAEAVLKGRSLFAGRMGEAIGNELLTVVDDGLMPAGLATSPFDDEGVPSRRTEMVSRGVLKSYFHTTYTASRSGTVSTGNASRGSYRDRPHVSPTNLFLEPGTGSREEIIREVGEGILVLQLVGVHAGANPISGEISLGAVGLLIKDGKLDRPLREITIAGQMLDLLHHIALVGSDLRFLPMGGSLGCATLALEGVMVAGRA